MGFWRDHGVIDFSVLFVCGRDSDVAGADRLTKQNICSILRQKNECSACFAVRKE